MAAPRLVPTAPYPPVEPSPVPDSLSDRGNAKLFAARHRHGFRYVPGLGWYRWSGHRWEDDSDHTVLWAAGDLAETLAERDPAGRHSPAALRRHRHHSLSTTGMRAMLEQARGAPGIALQADQLDADPYALCTPDGVVDLLTGTLSAPDPRTQLHSRATEVGPRAMPTPYWDRFLADTFGRDPEGARLVGYLQELLGYSITGDVGAQIMPFLFGSGKNGKSVLLDVMVKLLGGYADAAPPGFLMARPYERHSTDLAELHGRRIIVCAELRPGDAFDEARVKHLTGGDRIKARRMRQDFFSFTPTHKLWLLGNHRPEVGTGGFAFWRRMRLIPFDQVVPDHRTIDNLADLLVADEGPGILHWLITGARRYLAGDRGLAGPQRVRTATAAYAETEERPARHPGERSRLPFGLRADRDRLYSHS
ncbi:phage/plasmid primase, P4 family [Streptomyces sp. NPDC091272]|uniref:DNA primase family protein n=1 Tax=Streptomyces sp. NPDC091272 TaxID=3365981 RepID=UPI00381C0941